jgi:ketopantoate reductase
MPEWTIGAVSKTVVVLAATVGSNPTLSAGRKILEAAKAAHYRQPQSFGDMVLTDRGLTTEIAQFALGDLSFKVHYPHYIYSYALVKVLWDICSTISTQVLSCPLSSSMSQLSFRASIRSIQNRLSASGRIPLLQANESQSSYQDN